MNNLNIMNTNNQIKNMWNAWNIIMNQLSIPALNSVKNQITNQIENIVVSQISTQLNHNIYNIKRHISDQCILANLLNKK